MHHNRPVKKIAPAVRQELNRAAFYLDKHINKPLDSKSLLQEAMRIYKGHPFEYNIRATHGNVPNEAIDKMEVFLIVKGAIKAGFTPDEVSNLWKIRNAINSKQPGAFGAALDKISESKLRQMYSKWLWFENAVTPSMVLPHSDHSDFSKHPKKAELQHIAKFGAEYATKNVEIMGSHLGAYLEPKQKR